MKPSRYDDEIIFKNVSNIEQKLCAYIGDCPKEGTRQGRSGRIEMDRMGHDIKSVIIVLELVSVTVIIYALAAVTLLMVD